MNHDERVCPLCEEESSREVWRHVLLFTALGVVGLVLALGWHP